MSQISLWTSRPTLWVRSVLIAIASFEGEIGHCAARREFASPGRLNPESLEYGYLDAFRDNAWLCFNESESRVEHGMHLAGLVGDAGNGKAGVVRSIVGAQVSDRHIVAVRQPVQQALDDAPAVLEGESVGDEQINAEQTDDGIHG